MKYAVSIHIKSLLVCSTIALLIGCGSEEQAKTSDKPSSTAAQTATPTPGPTEPATTIEQAPATPDMPKESETKAAAEPAQAQEKPMEAPVAATSEQDPMLALAKKSGCLACHNVDKKIVGPAWIDVASRYAGNNAARDQLIDKVSRGGKGNWTEVTGGVAMPPYHPRVSKENISKLIDFILSLNK